jgi:aminoglycoside phosphotransferase (APT) family kinase protein
MPGLDDPSVLTIVPTFEVGWPVFLERFGDELSARGLRWCEQFVKIIPEWIADHYADRVTMTHGDFRLDNLFFYDDGSVGVIDWQMSMRAPGQGDLVSQFRGALDRRAADPRPFQWK